MRTPEKDFGLLYLENKAQAGSMSGWTAGGTYRFTWYDPRTGEWRQGVSLAADERGEIELPRFPGGGEVAGADWAAKIVSSR